MFLMVDSTDHVTGKTGLTPTVTLSKNGGAFASPSGAVTEVANGWYKVAGNATDTNTLGPLILHATGTAADPVDIYFDVVAVDPQSATAFITGVNSLAPPANWNLTGIDSSGIVQASMVQLNDNSVAADVAAIFFQAINDSSQDPSEVGDAFADAFAYFFDNASTMPPVASVAGAVGSVTGNVGGNVTGSVGSVSSVTNIVSSGAITTSGGAVSNVTTVSSVTTKTGYALASTGLDLVTAWTVAITGNITGNLSGSVGSVTGNVGGNVSGTVASVTGSVNSVSTPVTISGTITTLDALNTSLNSAHGSGSWATATGFSTLTAQQVWEYATREVDLVSINGNTNAALGIEGVGGQYFSNGILSAHVVTIATGAIDAASLAASAVTEIQSGLATASALATVDGIVDDIKAVAVKLDTMLVLDGVVYQFTANALENAASVDGVGDAEQATLLLVKAQTDKITLSQINTVSAFARSGITIKQGDSYIYANGTGATLVIPKPDGSTRYPSNLTGWTVTLRAQSHPDNSNSGTGTLSEALTVTDPTTTQDLHITSLTAAETAALKIGLWLFDIIAVSGTDTRTLVAGTMKVDEAQS